MQVVYNKSSRRSSFTNIFSPTRYHESTLRKRAQSLHAQSTRRNSILINNDSHPYSEGTLDRKSVLKLSISAPLSSSHQSRSHCTSDTDTAFVPTPRTSFIDTRQCEDPPNSAERKVQFVEFSLDHNNRSSLRDTTRNQYNTTRKRSVARVSISSGRIYYIEEDIPELRLASTRFSPPPPTSPRSHSYPQFRSRSLSAISIRPRALTTIPGGSRANRHTHYSTDNRDRGEEGIGGGFFPSGTGDSSSNSFNTSSPQEPLYISASERLYAQWGTFTLNVRFGMFRAHDKVKNGVAWVGGVVRRFRPRKQI